jgi:hypothetical protein
MPCLPCLACPAVNDEDIPIIWTNKNTVQDAKT